MSVIERKFFPDLIATADIDREWIFFLGCDPWSAVNSAGSRSPTLPAHESIFYQTCAESQLFHEKSSQVTQKSSHDFDFFEKTKKVKVMTLT
jgi:hypothetical protein